MPNLDYVNKIHNKLKAADAQGEISRINRIFYLSLKPAYRLELKLDSSVLELLDKANIYTWLAYSLYDNAFDEGEILNISSANILARSAYFLYMQAGVSPQMIQEWFSAVDSANYTELNLRANKQFVSKYYEPLLFGKSIAHCLGQIWITSTLCLTSYPKILEGFKDYCSARQLSDDIFDWRDDIRKNQDTFATVKLREQMPENLPQLKDLDLIQRLNVVFWVIGLEYLCKKVITFSDGSIEKLDEILQPSSGYTTNFIGKLSNGAKESISHHLLQKKELDLDVTFTIVP